MEVSQTLIEQVGQESEFCDFTVKLGEWEKKYHRCVLASSPFFESMFRNPNAIENHKGVVTLGIQTTSTNLEMALLFLYGRHPEFKMDNIGELLELAEFLMITDLKSECISWLRKLEIKDDNYIEVLQLSSKYNFVAVSCVRYIESHFNEVLLNEDAMTLSTDLLEHLFSDESFTYMDDKLLFLAKWVSQNPQETKEKINILFSKIDPQELSPNVLENVKTMSPFKDIVDLENLENKSTTEVDLKNERQRPVVLKYLGEGDFLLLDIQTNRWHSFEGYPKYLNTDMCDHVSPSGITDEVTGVRNAVPEVYSLFNRNDYSFPNMSVLNLLTKTENIHTFDIDVEMENLRNVCLKNDTIIGTAMPTQTEEPKETEVYMGKVSAKELIKLSPICSLGTKNIIDACLNWNSVAALLTESSKSVILFDTSIADSQIEDQIEEVEIESGNGYRLTGTETGFLIYNDSQGYYLSRPSQRERYQKKEFTLEGQEGLTVHYQYSNGIWFRISHKFDKDCFQFYKNDDGIMLEFKSHEDLLQGDDQKPWKPLSLPANKDLKLHWGELFSVSLSARTLGCHLQCPYCNNLSDESELSSDDED